MDYVSASEGANPFNYFTPQESGQIIISFMTAEGPLDLMLQDARTAEGTSPSPASGGKKSSCPSLD
jgi:hypothetical protein